MGKFFKEEWVDYPYFTSVNPRVELRLPLEKADKNQHECLLNPEGWVNSAIAESLRLHRGLKDFEKKVLVSIVMSHLKRGARPPDGGKRPFWHWMFD